MFFSCFYLYMAYPRKILSRFHEREKTHHGNHTHVKNAEKTWIYPFPGMKTTHEKPSYHENPKRENHQKHEKNTKKHEKHENFWVKTKNNTWKRGKTWKSMKMHEMWKFRDFVDVQWFSSFHEFHKIHEKNPRENPWKSRKKTAPDREISVNNVNFFFFGISSILSKISSWSWAISAFPWSRHFSVVICLCGYGKEKS